MKSNKFFDDIQYTKLDFVKNFFKFGAISVAIILAGIITWICVGFNLGLDFTGGSIVKIKFGQILENEGNYEEYVGEIKSIFGEYGITLSQIQQEDSGDDASIAVRFKDLPQYSEEEMTNLVTETIKPALIIQFNENGENETFDVYSSQRIGSTASSELLMNALLAIIISAVIMLIYIALRFQLISGVATLVTIVHDVLIMCAFVAIFRIEINSSFIAAIITVIGYSINNTIIVFDRVRENLRNEKMVQEGNAHIINVSIKQTLIRSIYTSATTLVSILALVILGVDSIRLFLLPIIVGLIAGAYSSVFLAGPLWQIMLKRYTNRKKVEAELRKIKNKEKTIAISDTNESIDVEVIEK